MPGTKSRTERALQIEDLEFRYRQLSETFGMEPKLPITVWDFPNAAVKKALVGAGETLYAKPWTREMFVQEHFPSSRLRHEMAHVFAGSFGDPFFGVALAWRWGPLPHPALAMGLVEGVAEAATVSDPYGDATIHQEAAAMIAAGLAPPLADVVGAGFSTLAGARAYTLAGSFSAFLLATRGADKLRALYRSAGNFSDVYRVPLRDLEREWRQFLTKQPLSTRQRAHATEEFRRPAIFSRVCARELAARVAEARGIMGVDPARAVELLRSTCHDDPNEPLYRLALARAELAAGAEGAARTELGHLALDGTLTVPLHAEAESLSAAIDFSVRDYAGAETHQRRALELAATEADRRQALAKLRALDSPPARATLGRALYADVLEPDIDPVLTFYLLAEYARLFPTDRLGPYLIGRQLLGRDAARALPQLTRACGDEQVADSPERDATGPRVRARVPPHDRRRRLPRGRLRARARGPGAARHRRHRGRSPARARHAGARRLGRRPAHRRGRRIAVSRRALANDATRPAAARARPRRGNWTPAPPRRDNAADATRASRVARLAVSGDGRSLVGPRARRDCAGLDRDAGRPANTSLGGDSARTAGRARAAAATGRRAHGDAAAGPAAHPRAAARDLASAPPLTLTPEPAPAPPLELDRRTAQPPSERPVPFYRKNWFWGTVGLVVLTTAIIVVSASTVELFAPHDHAGEHACVLVGSPVPRRSSWRPPRSAVRARSRTSCCCSSRRRRRSQTSRRSPSSSRRGRRRWRR